MIMTRHAKRFVTWIAVCVWKKDTHHLSCWALIVTLLLFCRDFFFRFHLVRLMMAVKHESDWNNTHEQVTYHHQHVVWEHWPAISYTNEKSNLKAKLYNEWQKEKQELCKDIFDLFRKFSKALHAFQCYHKKNHYDRVGNCHSHVWTDEDIGNNLRSVFLYYDGGNYYNYYLLKKT